MGEAGLWTRRAYGRGGPVGGAGLWEGREGWDGAEPARLEPFLTTALDFWSGCSEPGYYRVGVKWPLRHLQERGRGNHEYGVWRRLEWPEVKLAFIRGSRMDHPGAGALTRVKGGGNYDDAWLGRGPE